MRRLIPAVTVALTLTLAATASAYTPPTESITTAASHVAAATAGDPTLSHLSTDLNTPTLQAEGAEVMAVISALNTNYAGGSDPTSTILSNPTYLSAEPAETASIGSALTGAGDATATASLVGGDLLDVAAGLAIVPEAAAAAAVLPELAIGAAALGVIAITTGRGSEVIDLLTGSSSDHTFIDPMDSGNVASVRWLSVPENGQQTNDLSGGESAAYERAPSSCPSLPSVTGHSVYVLEMNVGTASAPVWLSCVDELYNTTPTGGSFILRPNPGSSSLLPSGSSPAVQSNGSPVSPKVAGWAPTGMPNSIFLEGSTDPGYNNCVINLSNGDCYWWEPTTVTRTGGKTQLGIPHIASVPSGVTPVTATPINSATKLGSAIAALPGDLGSHPEATQLIDGSLGANIGGTTVSVPGTFTIPTPAPYELVTKYVTDLNTAGFTNVITTTASDENEDPTRGPSEVIGVTPKTGTSVSDQSQQVSVLGNPADAPSPAGDTNPGTSTGSGAPIFNAPNIPSLDMDPLRAVGNLCTTFPFGIPCWMFSLVGQFAGSPITPSVSFHFPFNGDDSNMTTLSLSVLDPYIVAIRASLTIVILAFMVWKFYSLAFGGAGGAAEGDDD